MAKGQANKTTLSLRELSKHNITWTLPGPKHDRSRVQVSIVCGIGDVAELLRGAFSFYLENMSATEGEPAAEGVSRID